MYWIYIIECLDGSFYTGICKDISKRMNEHYFKLPKAAKYTKSHGVKSLVALWTVDSRSDASKLEYFIKTLERSQKELLIKDNSILKDLCGDRFDSSIFNPIDEVSIDNYINTKDVGVGR